MHHFTNLVLVPFLAAAACLFIQSSWMLILFNLKCQKEQIFNESEVEISI